jgi:hypothetical protein
MTTRLATLISLAAGVLTLALAMAPVHAQGTGGTGGTGGAGGTSAGGASGAGARGSAAARSSQGTAPSGTSGQASPNSSLNNNAGAQGQTIAPTPNAGTGQSATSSGGAASGGAAQSGQGGPGTNAQDSSSSSSSQAQANNPTSDRSLPTQQQPLTCGGTSRREGAAGHDLASCMATWDKGTHITKARWREICARTLRDQEAVRREAQSYNPKRW